MDIRQFANRLFDRGDDPFNLTGKRDDTMDLLLAVLNSQGVPDAWMDVEEEKKPEKQKTKDEFMWEQFQSMNPNLDYEAVARQSGGNVPGGSFSDMRVSPGVKSVKEATPGASDEEFYKWVKEINLQTNMDSMLDPRSRGYDPAAAEILQRAASQERQDAAYAIRQAAEQQKADIERRQEEYQYSTGGRIDNMLRMISSSDLLQMQSGDATRMLILAKDAWLRGDEAAAQELTNKAAMMLQGVSQQEARTAAPSTEQPGTDLVFRRGRGIR